MFYQITAYNTSPMVVWSSNENSVDRYVDWLNRNREINVYSAHAIGETGYEDEVNFSMDEPCWDDFMDVEEDIQCSTAM